MAQNENPSGVTWLGWQQFILWRWSFSFKEICTEFGSRKADVPWTFMILGELGHQLNRSGKGFCHCFFQSYSTPCPLDFKNGWELFSLFPIYPYSTETLHSYLVPLAAFTLQSLLWPRHSQTVLYFFVCFALDFEFTPKRPAHTECSFLRHFIKQFSPQGCMNPQTLTDK